MKLYESGALELIKDIENNRTNVSPEEIAPDVDEDEILPGIRYDSSKDPEAGGGDDSTGLNESTRLTEGYDDDFKDWLSSTDDGSFEDFQNSDSYENIGKRPWTQQQYKDAISRIRRSDPTFDLPAGISGKNKRDVRAYSRDKSRFEDKPVSNGSVYEIDDFSEHKMSKATQAMVDEYSDADPTPTAEETFEEMGSIIKDIILGQSDKRHALIAGDPGIGKSTSYDEKIKISIGSIYANQFEKWLSSGKKYNDKGLVEITVEIGKFFDFLKEVKGVKFVTGEFSKSPFPVYIKDEKDDLAEITDWIEKKSDIYEITFDNGMKKKLADEHLISVEPFFSPDKCTTRYVKDWEVGDDIPYLQTKCTSNKKILENQDVFGFSVDTEKHLYKDAEGMIHHNTYTAKEVAKKYIGSSGKKLTYEAGNIGGSMTTVIPFFFFHNDNEIIILDDHGKMLMANADQAIKNIMKKILDPDALQQPISVPSNMLPKFQQQLEILEGSGLDESVSRKKNYKGNLFDIDLDSLKEGVLHVSIDGETVCNEVLSLDEAQELSNRIRPLNESEKRSLSRKLHEAEDITEGYEETDDDGNALLDTGEGDGELNTDLGTFPRTFVFNSSVIFISNLDFKDITDAVLDRCESVEVKLTLEQFMTRLQTVLGGRCKSKKYSSTPQVLRDWAKKCVYTTLLSIVEAFYSGVTLFKTPVVIRRKFTFRMFEEFCTHWIRKARDIADREDLNLNDKNVRDELAKRIVPLSIKQKMLPWMTNPISKKGEGNKS